MLAGASPAASTCVMTRCHSFALHWWLVSAFAEICCVDAVTMTEELGVAWAAAMPSHGTTARAATTTPATRSERPLEEGALCLTCMRTDLQDDDSGGGL